MKWQHIDQYVCRDYAHNVEVRHWTVDEQPLDMTLSGPHRWGVYAHLGRCHPLFARISGGSLSQEALRDAPLHGGCTYLSYSSTGGWVASCVTFGADYNHLSDTGYTHMATAENATAVFQDAKRLAEWLAEMMEAHP